MFHYCSAEDGITPPSIVQGPPTTLGGNLPGVGGGPLGFEPLGALPVLSNFNPTNLMGQIATLNMVENIPKYTEPIVQATKNMIDSVNQIRKAMGIPEFTPNEPNAENEQK